MHLLAFGGGRHDELDEGLGLQYGRRHSIRKDMLDHTVLFPDRHPPRLAVLIVRRIGCFHSSIDFAQLWYPPSPLSLSAFRDRVTWYFFYGREGLY